VDHAFVPTPAAANWHTASCGAAAAVSAPSPLRYTKDSRLANLPLHGLAQNQIWCAIVALACQVTAWMPTSSSSTTTPAAGSPSGCGAGTPGPPGGHRRRLSHLAGTAPFAALALHARHPRGG
jgi:hypothetical protein